MKWKSFTTGALLALGLVLLLAAAAPTLYTPWTSFRGTNQVTVTTNPSTATLVIGPASPISTIASNAAKSLMVWTNDGGIIRLVQYPSNAWFSALSGRTGSPAGPDLNLGSNSVAWFDNAFGDPRNLYSFISSRFTDGGDTNRNDIWISSAIDINGNTYGAFNGRTRTNSATLNCEVNTAALPIQSFKGGYDPDVGGLFIALNNGVLNVFDVNDAGSLSAQSNAFFGGRIHTSFGLATNAATFGFITTNLLSGQVYTNFAQRGHVVANVALTNVLAGDVSAMSLIVDQNGDGTWDTTNGPVRLNGVALLAGEMQLQGRLQPSARFAFTNQSAGATPGSATIRSGSCQWSRE